MSNPLLKPPPTIQETTNRMGGLNLADLTGGDWDPMSTLGVNSSEDKKRGSVQLSVVSEESRRQSLFTPEGDDFLADDMATDDTESEEHEDDEERKRKRQDEVFVDKARAAMVVIGTKDIKEALERKKAVEISRRTPEAKVCHILFHQAKFLMQQSRFREALIFINRALNVNAENKDWLTEKGRCYLNLLQPDVALQYVDKVLKKDPQYFKAVVLKGEILYSLWDLERAMLCFVEGRRMRPENTECIKGVHKVKMALEEIAEFKVPANERKKKTKKRSKSAKGRLTSASPTECLMTGNRDPPSLSSRRPSSRLSPLSEASTSPTVSHAESPSFAKRPSTAFTGRRLESPSISRSQKSEQRQLIERPMSAKGKRGSSARPKTALNRRSRSKSVSKDLEIDDIRRFVRESMSGSYKSSTLRCFSGSTQQSERSGFSSSNQSFSSSMEDVSRESGVRKFEPRTKLPKVKTKTNIEGQPRTKVTPGTKVSVFLGQDKIFLDSLLKDKDLKRSKTAYTKRALRIAREVQGFVTEREKYWKDRENFTRYATAEEDTLI